MSFFTKTGTAVLFLIAGILVIRPGTSFALADTTPPDPISSITLLSDPAGAVGLSWNVTGDDGAAGDLDPGAFRIDHSSDPYHSFSNAVYTLEIATTASAGSAQSCRLTGLLGNATYYVTVYIGDEVPNYSGLSQIGQVLTTPYPPSLTAFSAVSTGSFTAGLSTANASGTEYYVEASTSSDFAAVSGSGWIASTSIGFPGLQPRTTYYVRAKVRDAAGAQSSWTSLGSVLLDQYPGTSAPKAPLAEGAYSGGVFTLSWAAMTENVLNAAINIKSYEVYVSTAIGAPRQWAASLSSSTLSWSAAVSAAKRYSVAAVDEYNNPGAGSGWIKNTNGSAATVSDDGKAYLDISKAVNDQLKLLKLAPGVAHQPSLETGATLAAYKVYFKDQDNNDVVNRDFPGEVSLTLPYAAGSSFGGALVSPRSAYDYAVFYDNGVEEVPVGGQVDPSCGVLSVAAAKAGTFRVKQSARPESFRITQTVPKKIFTPNGDGVWDDFNILFENPQALELGEARVFDLSGARVADLIAGGPYGPDSLRWDGRKSGGEKAGAAVYIYQFKAGDKYYNGTIVLAR